MRNLHYLKLTLSAALLSAVMAITSFAATGKLSFSDPSAVSGEEVNVTMKIAADDGATLTDANVTLTYDASKLEFVAGTDADGGAGTVRVHGVSNGAGTSELQYNLKFKTLAAGQSSISVSTQEVYDGDSQPVELTHLGSSTITVNAQASVSQNADLAALQIAPGTLTPDFSADVTSYEATVGTSVDQLSVSAQAADGAASVVLSGNEGLAMGDNSVRVTVTAADGQTSKVYTILVHKQEGGAENASAEAENTDSTEGESETATETEPSGVQLSSKGKTITIMNPGSDVQIPAGFNSSTIVIDGQRVQGWVWGAEQDPKYCVVYGMNDQGELNFYRYDMGEKTIQRYFEDPLAANSVSNQEYTALADSYNQMLKDYDMRFLIICILGLGWLLFIVTIIYLFAKLRAAQRAESRMNKTQNSARWNEAEETDDSSLSVYDENILKHDFEQKDEEPSAAPIDETQVLRRPQPRRRGKNSAAGAGDTTPLPELHGLPDETGEGGNSSGTDAASKETGSDDEFDTFNI
ncbi:MAG: cadherin-like beta sandwich domain-containing protein [Eubacteriales bacterium]|nr:cadherin-like beta sandwich domain-containing protein [Eubacteriales bacterium]